MPGPKKVFSVYFVLSMILFVRIFFFSTPFVRYATIAGRLAILLPIVLKESKIVDSEKKLRGPFFVLIVEKQVTSLLIARVLKLEVSSQYVSLFSICNLSFCQTELPLRLVLSARKLDISVATALRIPTAFMFMEAPAASVVKSALFFWIHFSSTIILDISFNQRLS
jgi:hypothetical protein